MRKPIVFYLILSMFTGFQSALIIAQDESLSVTVNKNKIKMGDVIELEIRFDGIMGEYYPPDLSDFSIVSGPNHSISMIMSFGKTQRSSTYTYSLKPNKPGKLTIGEAKLVNNKDTFTTEPITIYVDESPDFFENNPKPIPSDKKSTEPFKTDKKRPEFKL